MLTQIQISQINEVHASYFWNYLLLLICLPAAANFYIVVSQDVMTVAIVLEMRTCVGRDKHLYHLCCLLFPPKHWHMGSGCYCYLHACEYGNASMCTRLCNHHAYTVCMLSIISALLLLASIKKYHNINPQTPGQLGSCYTNRKIEE